MYLQIEKTARNALKSSAELCFENLFISLTAFSFLPLPAPVKLSKQSFKAKTVCSLQCITNDHCLQKILSS